MTEPRRGDDDGAGEPPETAGERAERDWLIARELDPTAPPPSEAIARDYAQLEQLLAESPVLDEDDSWHAAILQRAAALPPVNAAAAPSPTGLPTSPRPAPRARPRWWQQPAFRWGLGGGGVLAAAAATAVLALYPASALALELWTTKPAGVMRGGSGDYAVGDRLGARLRSGPGVVMVYQPDGAMVARCPGGPACVARPEGPAIDLVLEEPGNYDIIGLASSPSFATDGTVSDVVRRAREAHVDLVKRRIEAR